MKAVLATFFLASFASPQVPSFGWDSAGMTATRPALSYHEEGRPRLVMTCKGTQTELQIRGFTAAQKWPQPALIVKFGTVERSANPDLTMIADQTAFSFNFPISDRVLAALRNGETISATYQGQTRNFPAISAAHRSEFADKCAALVPPGMRGS